MPPLTRGRTDTDRAHTALGKEYYDQRSRIPGSLIVTEGVYITEGAGGFPTVPGLYNDKQVEAWRKVSFLLAILWNPLLSLL